jgi:hypothetical protein
VVEYKDTRTKEGETGIYVDKLVDFYPDDSNESTQGSIVKKRNVVATWYTPVMDLGSNLYGKTLYGLSMATEPGDNGPIVFGYETKEALNDLGVKGDREFRFTDMDFTDFSFNTGFAHSYTVRVKQRNFNYIMMRLVSDSDKNCSLNNISLIYKGTKLLKGVR